jgi:hypothetical protein
VGFSVEKRYTEQLPIVAFKTGDAPVNVVVEDSKAGWAVGLREVLEGIYAGREVGLCIATARRDGRWGSGRCWRASTPAER